MPKDNELTQEEAILQRLDEMDKARENSPLMGELGKLSDLANKTFTKVKVIETKTKSTSKKVDLTHKIVTGNGDPEKGMVNRITNINRDISDIQSDLSDHIKAHEAVSEKEKEKKKELKDKVWDITKPVMIEVVKLLVTGGVLYQALIKILPAG